MSAFIGNDINDAMTVEQLMLKLKEVDPQLKVCASRIPVMWIDIEEDDDGNPYLDIS